MASRLNTTFPRLLAVSPGQGKVKGVPSSFPALGPEMEATHRGQPIDNVEGGLAALGSLPDLSLEVNFKAEPLCL